MAGLRTGNSGKSISGVLGIAQVVPQARHILASLLCIPAGSTTKDPTVPLSRAARGRLEEGHTCTYNDTDCKKPTFP